jgi:hypothetical protein
LILSGRLNVTHLSRYRVIPGAGQAVNDGAHDEVRAEILGQTVEFHICCGRVACVTNGLLRKRPVND